MPHLLDTPTRAQAVCTAISRLIVTGGTGGVAARVAHVRGQERLMLGAALGRTLRGSALDCAHAMVEGLRGAVCTGDDPMPVEQARRALQLGLRGLGGGA